MTVQEIQALSQRARMAAQRGEWDELGRCATRITQLDGNSEEGHFLAGLYQKAANQPRLAIESFEKALQLNEARYDAAIELADRYLIARRNSDARRLLDKYSSHLDNSPRYLDLAGTAYSTLGLPEQAWSLYVKADALQPGVDLFRANKAACAVFLGKIDEAREIYTALLEKYPNHQRNHYHLSRLERARDDTHINAMKGVLAAGNMPPEQNVFLYFAIGKELEDLERWEEAFDFYQQGGDAILRVANYDVKRDIALIDTIIDGTGAAWIAAGAQSPAEGPQPVFICGLPRTGTTLTERILASHSTVTSLGETEFVEIAMRELSGVQTQERASVDIVNALAGGEPAALANRYREFVDYRLDDTPWFIDKLPYNFLYLGHIARAFPKAKLVHLRRHPMDACFAMYKQVFTWAYKFSYSQESIAEYYLAYVRLMQHWRDVLGDRLVEVEYEALTADTEPQTRALLERLGLPFEEACLNPEKNRAASTTASSVQIREKAHTRSVGRWRHFERQLAPLAERLRAGGIELD